MTTMADGNGPTRQGVRGEFSRRTRTLVLVGVGVVLLVVLLLSFRPQAVAVDLAPVTRGTVEVVVKEDGRTRVRDRYQITAPVAGTLRRITLEPGDAVEAGAVVATVDGPEAGLADARTRSQLQARLAAARAGVEGARALAEGAEAGVVDAREEVRTQEVLLQGGSGSTSALDRARALLRGREAEARSAAFRVEAAQGEVEDLRLALAAPSGAGEGAAPGSGLSLRAPVEGVVLRVFRESGGAVGPGEPLLEVGDPGALEAVVDLLSADAIRVREGAEATLTGWGGDQELEARVRRVEPAGFTRVSALGIEEQRVNVILEPGGGADGAGWPALGDGFRVEARILVDRASEVLRVPAGALFRRGDGWAVFVAEGGRLRERAVEPGRRSQAWAEIVDGVAQGEEVVIYPSDRAEDGGRYRAR
jgi:HlyD family secretion protein